MKQRKIEVMSQIDDNFDQVVKQLLHKKAEVKMKYAEAMQVEEAHILKEQEQVEKHISLI